LNHLPHMSLTTIMNPQLNLINHSSQPNKSGLSTMNNLQLLSSTMTSPPAPTTLNRSHHQQ
jgi:hypothetical protein